MSLDLIMKAVTAANPGFTLARSSLKGVLTAINTGGSGVATSLQSALDLLEVSDAERYKDALQLVVNDYPTTSYAGLKSFNLVSTPNSFAAYAAAEKRVRYTSAKMTATAGVYCIQPPGMNCDIGFVQHCTAKSDVAKYTGGQGMRDETRPSMPVGDSSNPSDSPFYFKGVSFECTNPAWVDLKGKVAGIVNLEVNDYFNRNFHFYHPQRNSSAPQLASFLDAITRKQSFSLWVAHRNPTRTRLLQEGKFTIKVAVKTRRVGTAVTVSNLSTCEDIKKRKPAANERLPPVSAPVMNNASRWQYRANDSSPWVDMA